MPNVLIEIYLEAKIMEAKNRQKIDEKDIMEYTDIIICKSRELS
jgi:hypothetical protein